MMAESDAAGPGTDGGPKSRALTREDIARLAADAEREWQSLTPAERARRKAEAEKADHDAFEEARRAMGPTLEAFGRAMESARQSVAAAFQPAPWALAAPAILDPNKRGEALNEALSRIEPAHRPVGPEEIRAVVADAMKATMAEPKKDRKPRGESTCERLRDLHVNIDPDFAETASERQLGRRIERSPGTFPDSHYWRTVLKPKREEVRTQKKKVRRARKYGHFDSVGRADQDSEAH